MRDQYAIDDFSGGINALAQMYKLDASQSPDAQNCYMQDIDTVQSRLGVKGHSKVNTSGVTITDLYTFKRDDASELMLAFGGGNSYYFSAAASAWCSIPSGMSVWNQINRINFIQYQDVAYLRDGYSAYKITGSATALQFTRMGVSAPSGTLTATCGGVGNLNGSYAGWQYTYVNSLGVEGNPNSAMTTALTLASGVANVSGMQVPGPSFGVNGMRFYRPVAGGSTYKYVGSAAVTTNFADNIADASLGAVVPSNNYPPPSTVAAAMLKDRMFFAGAPSASASLVTAAWYAGGNPSPAYAYYSEIAAPEQVGATNFFRFDWDGQRIWTLAAGTDQLIVGKTQSVYQLYMPSPGNPLSWYPKKVLSEFGSECPFFAPKFGDNKFLMLSRFGFIVVSQEGEMQTTQQLASDSTNTQLASKFIYTYQVPTASANLGPGRMTMSPSNMVNASGISYNNNVWIAIADASSSNGSANAVWLYNYVRGRKAKSSAAWWRMAGLTLSAFTVYNNNLYAASSRADGYVYQLDVPDQYYDMIASAVTGGTLATKPIDAYWRSKPLANDGNDFWTQKDFRRIRGALSTQTGTYAQLRYVTDQALTFNVANAGLVGQDPLLDANGNVGTVANATRQFVHKLSAGVSGKNLRVEVSNYALGAASGTSGTAFKLQELEIWMNNRGIR